MLSLVLCVPLCPSGHFLTPCQQKVVIPKMPWEEWACELPHYYVIADPIRGIVLYSATSVPVPSSLSATWLATLISVPIASCVRRPLPYWGANPESKELNQSPTSARETKSTLPYCSFWEGPGCSLHLRTGGRRIPGEGGREIAAFCSCSIPSRRQRRRHHCLAEVFACLCVFGFFIF